MENLRRRKKLYVQYIDDKLGAATKGQPVPDEQKQAGPVGQQRFTSLKRTAEMIIRE